jgi:Cu2+-containing amine oxidase
VDGVNRNEICSAQGVSSFAGNHRIASITMIDIKHPLEPLGEEEVRLAVKILKDSGKVTPTTRFYGQGGVAPGSGCGPVR